MAWQDQLKGDSVSWLLEDDSPGVRYLALRDLIVLAEDDLELKKVRRRAHTHGPIAEVLDKMNPAGYWVEPGPGYGSKYRSTVWATVLLAQLGARIDEDKRISAACAYVLDHALTPGGQFTATKGPGGTVDCLQGNLCWALVEMGCEDRRLSAAYEWMARTVTGEGLADAGDRSARMRYYAGKCGPSFACGANNKLPCAWGAAKAMLAFGVWPKKRRSPLIRRAIEQGVEFIFSVDPAEATYPTGYADKPSRNWWKFGFPVFYVTDILQIAEALATLGSSSDTRLSHALALIRNKQDVQGRWALEYGYSGKTWCEFGPLKQANKWVTLRALRVLKAVVQ